jgi:hypothetical protein
MNLYGSQRTNYIWDSILTECLGVPYGRECGRGGEERGGNIKFSKRISIYEYLLSYN